MVQDPKVSLISVFYNRANLVDESVESLIKQDYRNLEIILIDDNSSDSTYSKLLRFETLDGRVRVIQNQNNKGFVNTLTDTINTCDSQFIAIHGSGDISYMSRISEQIKIMKEHDDVGVVGCSVEVVGRRFNTSADSSWIFNETRCHENGKYTLLNRNYFTHGEVLIRRSYYDQVGGYRKQFKYAQDLDLWCRMSEICNFYVVDKVLYKRFLLSDGATANFQKAIVQQMLGDFARQCHTVRLRGEKDYIERYGDQGLLFFSYTKRFCKRIYYLILKAQSVEDNSSNLSSIAKFLLKKTFNLYTLLIYVLIVLLPRNIVIALGRLYQWFKRKIFKK